MRETMKHVDAFNYFFQMREKGYNVTKSIEETAKHTGYRPATVWHWHNELDWKNKFNKRIKEISEEIERKQVKTFAQNRIQYLNVAHALLDDLIQEKLSIEIENVKDLETIIKLCLILQEAPDKIIKTENTVTTETLDDLFDEDIMKKILEDEDLL